MSKEIQFTYNVVKMENLISTIKSVYAGTGQRQIIAHFAVCLLLCTPDKSKVLES